jgi:hypothetical protein
MLALDESRDLARGDACLDNNRTLAETIAGHQTPILSGQQAEQLSFSAARDRYLDYAQEQLASAALGQPVASMALYGLGRSEAATAGASADAAIAIACYRAALAVDARNFLASNELGIHLARRGQYRMARRHLIASWEEGKQPTTLKNLVVVHRKLGESDLAGQAEHLWLAMTRTRGASTTSQPGIRWTDSATFAQTSDPAAPIARRAVAAPPVAARPASRPQPPSTSWLPWKPKTRR